MARNCEGDLLEIEQHASIPRLTHGFELERRDFFKLLGAGILICIASSAPAQESGHHGGGPEQDVSKSIDAWLHISENNVITVYTGKVEVGQNIRTSLSQQVAEELRVPVSAIKMVMGDTDLTPYDMGTFGSRTTPTMAPQLRNAAASARLLLIELAAKQWEASERDLVADDGKIRNRATGRSATYGQLARGQQLVSQIPDDPELTQAANWRIAGTPVPKLDGHAFVTGAHKYPSDIALPGMLYGKVLRSNRFRASLSSLDTAAAEKMSGVTVVRDGEFVGVAAADESAANSALRALKAQWSAPDQVSEPQLFDHLRKTAEKSPASSVSTNPGRAAAKKAAQTYSVAYIAHAPLEPRAAVAEWKNGALAVWTGTQRPFGVRDELAEAFHIPKNSVHVIMPDTGSAYGGKHTGEAAVEAARIAKAVGKPVKLVWTREEEFTWAYFRPAGVIDVSAGVASDGRLVFWEFDNYGSGPSAIKTPYKVADQRIEFHEADSPLRTGSYRGLAATANHFARESHMDELAHAIEMDPLEFRLKNLEDERLRAVLETAAKKFGWGREKSSAMRGFGIAGGVEKGGYVATCAEVEIRNGAVRIRRVTEAFECGAVVNPNGLKNQIAGAIVQGIGGAMFEAVHFEDGKISNPHFAGYRVPRFLDAPTIEVELVDRKDLPSAGAGETPIVGIAPAVSNAIFAATGVRLRSLPMLPSGKIPEKS
jgi:CO/xanthine dehydrogenase Mo-binding subunit